MGLIVSYPKTIQETNGGPCRAGRSGTMKGYSTAAGYMGYVAWLGKYILFSTDEEYRDFLED